MSVKCWTHGRRRTPVCPTGPRMRLRTARSGSKPYPPRRGEHCCQQGGKHFCPQPLQWPRRHRRWRRAHAAWRCQSLLAPYVHWPQAQIRFQAPAPWLSIEPSRSALPFSRRHPGAPSRGNHHSRVFLEATPGSGCVSVACIVKVLNQGMTVRPEILFTCYEYCAAMTRRGLQL